ncbi:MAG: L-2-amino-thiazoline-4-carboxylic acid hydrolase [Proteobacteria bacterium]|nr:L-2-amino-thiazoline-4-carboxylic acid hydrolase [Pseudomonadota bacterium]
MGKTDLPILEQRRIEASVIKPIFEEMVKELGLERASEILGKAIRKDARAQGKSYAESQEEPTSLMGFHSLLPQWTVGGALEMDILKEEDTQVEFNVTRCRYAEMYKEMGLGHIGHLLSCGRDGTFCEGYDSRIKLERTQTIMQGASHCDFRFTETNEE